MAWIIPYILSLAFITALLVYWRVRDNRYLKKSVKEAMSEGLREEIRKEKVGFIARQEKFAKALEEKNKKLK